MLEVGRSLVVDLARFGFSNLACPPLGALDFATLLEGFLEGVAELASESQQKYRLLSPEDR